MENFNHTLTCARAYANCTYNLCLTDVLGIGCMRFKYGRHMVAYTCIEHLHSFITTSHRHCIGEHLLWPSDVDDSSLLIQF